MSPRERFSGFSPSAKKPPPKDGIKIKKSGTTWWGARWIGALELVLRGDAGRLARGRTYARAGRTHDLTIEHGKVSAKVTGSRTKPYEIVIELSRLSDDHWTRAIVSMAEKAQFSAALLAGEMPQEIDQAFHVHEISLFPTKRAELKTSCSCPDWGDPCKHIAATHYVLGEALDRDPFLLFELRGRSKDQVLAALRAARGAQPEHTDEAKLQAVASVQLGSVSEADYDKPKTAAPDLHLTFDPPRASTSLLQQLGSPSTWHDATPPATSLAALIQAAAQRARTIALCDRPAPEPAAPDPPGAAPSPTRASPVPAVQKPRAQKTTSPRKNKPAP
jgi:uncharacterized Zn finger protein